MIEWRDNSNHSVEADIAEALRLLANRSLSALLKDHGKSLLIFPQSLQQSPDLQKELVTGSELIEMLSVI